MMKGLTLLLSCLWALLCSHRSAAFIQKQPVATRTTSERQETKLCSILDTITSIGGIAPSTPILESNKGLLKSLLSGTYLESNMDSVKCVYKASRDGWSAIDFHKCVDTKGSGLVVARTRTGATFGGFNPNGWRSTDDYYISNTAFLWHLQGGSKAVKSPILPGQNAAVYDYATGGPNFGSDDLVLGEPQAAIMGGFAGPDMENVRVNAGNLKQGRCSFSGAYNFSKQWPVRGRFQLVEVEVYSNVGAGGSKRKSFW